MKIRYGLVDPAESKCLDRYGDMSAKQVWRSLLPSVEKHGIVNPVILWATKGDLRVMYGISRMQVGKHLGLLVPAVICDYDSRFPDFPEMRTVDEIAALWSDPDAIRPYLKLSPTKLWMVHHPRVPINDQGDPF